jgi:glyoxylase-like metal-dependent hydrolase (beta-lactamase superfamily II)
MAIARIFAIAGATCVALIAAAVQAQQAERPPVATTKVAGTDNVYIFRNGNNQSMFIVTAEGVIATDPISYGKPNGGRLYVDEIRKVTDKPIKYLIYSHHHFDHAAGGKPFKEAGATVVGHRRVKERLTPLQDPDTVLPDEVVGDEGRTITLGGTTLELVYLGPNHSDSNLIMRLPKEKIIFLVDTIPVGQVPARGILDVYPLETEEFIKKVIAMDWERMIPGHPGVGDRLGTKQDAQDQLALLQEASAEIKKMARDGKCWEPAEKELKLPKYQSWPGYEAGIPLIARRYCALWGRGF